MCKYHVYLGPVGVFIDICILTIPSSSFHHNMNVTMVSDRLLGISDRLLIFYNSYRIKLLIVKAIRDEFHCENQPGFCDQNI